MIENPSCTDINQAKANASRLGVRLRRWVLYPLLALAGCHMLGTGSPVPLWHIERLDHPVGVKAVQDDALVLEDGRRVQLPFIKKLPKGDSAFDGALARMALRSGRTVGFLVSSNPLECAATIPSSITDREST